MYVIAIKWLIMKWLHKILETKTDAFLYGNH